jgi:hypothetical protein
MNIFLEKQMSKLSGMKILRALEVLFTFSLTFGAIVLGCLFIVVYDANAADHIDAPLVREDARKDITDVFAFRSPSNSANIVLAMNMFTPVGAPDSSTLFDPESQGEYAIFIDTDGDQVEEHIIRVTFSESDSSGQSYTMRGIPGVGSINGDVSTTGSANITTSGAVRTFAGLRDDPFYFDFEAFNAFLAAPCIPAEGLRCPGTGSPVDFFLGLNVASIVVEFPLTSLSNINSSNQGTIGVWAKTYSK